MTQSKILKMDHANWRIQGIGIDRNPSETAFAKYLNQILFADCIRDRNDFGLWDCDILNTHAAKIQNAQDIFCPRFQSFINTQPVLVRD